MATCTAVVLSVATTLILISPASVAGEFLRNQGTVATKAFVVAGPTTMTCPQICAADRLGGKCNSRYNMQLNTSQQTCEDKIRQYYEWTSALPVLRIDDPTKVPLGCVAKYTGATLKVYFNFVWMVDGIDDSEQSQDELCYSSTTQEAHDNEGYANMCVCDYPIDVPTPLKYYRVDYKHVPANESCSFACQAAGCHEEATKKVNTDLAVCEMAVKSTYRDYRVRITGQDMTGHERGPTVAGGCNIDKSSAGGFFAHLFAVDVGNRLGGCDAPQATTGSPNIERICACNWVPS